MELPWPDEPMRHGYAEPGMDGLKEYQGDAEAIVGFVGGAEIAITQLAPFSAAMLERMPALKLIVVARGGPVNIDLAAARERDILIVNAPGRNASAVAEFTIGAIIAETRLITRGHDALRRGDVARRPLSSRPCRPGVVADDGRRDRLRPYRDEGRPPAQGVRRAHSGRRPLRRSVGRGRHATASVKTTLETLLRESDVVTLHARVTAGNARLHRPGRIRRHAQGGGVHQYGARADGRL